SRSGFIMPDWSYRTLFRPVLFRLPAETARDLCLGLMGALARLPLGPAVVDFLGHIPAPARLAPSFLGNSFPAPLGLGGIDPNAIALPAFARFGFGYLEVGPVALEPQSGNGRIELCLKEQAIYSADAPIPTSLEALLRRLVRTGSLSLPLL